MTREDLNQFILVTGIGGAVLGVLLAPLWQRWLGALTSLQQAGVYFGGTALVIAGLAWAVTRRP